MKKLLTLILAALMVLGLAAGCADDTRDSSATPTATPTPATATPSDSGAGGEEEEDTSISFPLDEPVEFSTFTVLFATNISDLNDVRAYQEMEKLSNVHIKWATASFVNYQENFNLSLASGDYYDSYQTINVFNSSNFWIGGYDKYVDEGTIYDLKPYIEQHAPAYYGYATANETARKGTITDTGKMPFMRTMNYGLAIEPTWNGYWIRNDWAVQEGINFDDVVTYDDWDAMLSKLNSYSNKGVLAPSYTGVDAGLLAGFGLHQTYTVENGEIIYGPGDQRYLNYLTTLNDWYKKGYIDEDFISYSNSSDNSRYYNGDNGVIFSSYSAYVNFPPNATDPNFELKPLTYPVQNAGDTRHFSIGTVPTTFLGGGNHAISTACEYPEIFVKWLDYWYTDEGMLLGNYGIEGESYEFVAGQELPQFTDVILNNPDGHNSSAARNLYHPSSVHAKLYDWRIGYNLLGDDYVWTIVNDYWDGNYVDTSHALPEVAMTSEEASEYNATYNDVDTYVKESTLAFITGSRPLSDFDAYVQQLNTLGLQKMLSIQKAALDRYNAK